MSGRKDEGRMDDGDERKQSNNLVLWEFRRGIGQSELSDWLLLTLWVHSKIKKYILHKYTHASLSFTCTKIYFQHTHA